MRLENPAGKGTEGKADWPLKKENPGEKIVNQGQWGEARKHYWFNGRGKCLRGLTKLQREKIMWPPEQEDAKTAVN